MRILADQAAGGDMEKLEEMFDKGILYTEKYLPAVLAEMKRQSDGMMEEYWKSLPYMINQANRQRDLWLREFTAGGGEAGLSAFWNSWIQIQKDAIRFAGDLGKAFEGIAKEFSAAILLPGELVKWLNGETDARNFFVNMFGESKDIELLQSLFSEANILADNLGFIGDATPSLISMDTTLKEIKMILSGINSLLNFVNKPLSAIQSVSQRGVMGHMAYTEDKKSMEEAERLAAKSPHAVGSPARHRYKMEQYQRLVQERRDSWIPDSWRYQWGLVKGGVLDPLWGASTSVGQWMVDTATGKDTRTRLRSEGMRRRGELVDGEFSNYYPENSGYHTFGQTSARPAQRFEFTIDQNVDVVVRGDSDTVMEFLTTGVSEAANDALNSKIRETLPNYGWTPQ